MKIHHKIEFQGRRSRDCRCYTMDFTAAMINHGVEAIKPPLAKSSRWV